MTQYYMSVWEWKAYPHFMMNCGIFSSKKRTDKKEEHSQKKKNETIERANRTAWLLDEKIFAKAMEREGSSRWLIHFTSFWIIWGSLKIGIREKSMIYHHVPLLEYITLLLETKPFCKHPKILWNLSQIFTKSGTRDEDVPEWYRSGSRLWGVTWVSPWTKCCKVGIRAILQSQT